jgi:hypothetical protein
VPKRRWLRFVLEVIFLVAVAVALTIADLRPAAVVGMMAAGWFVVALFEWAVWLDEPHFGRGLPPRFYVPDVALPPPLPIDQARSSYAVAAPPEDAPTWIASPADWGGAFDEWPVLDSTSIGEETEIVVVDAPADEAPFVADAPEQAAHPAAELDRALDVEDETEAPSIEDSVVQLPPVLDFLEEPILPEEAPSQAEEQPLEEERAAEPFQPDEHRAPIVAAVARHRVDPLSTELRGRFFRRRAHDEVITVEVPDGPPTERVLPGRARRPE